MSEAEIVLCCLMFGRVERCSVVMVVATLYTITTTANTNNTKKKKHLRNSDLKEHTSEEQSLN